MKNLYSKAAAFLGGFFMGDDVLHYALYMLVSALFFLVQLITFIAFAPLKALLIIAAINSALFAILFYAYPREVTQEQCKNHGCDIRKGWYPGKWNGGFAGGKWNELFRPSVGVVITWAVFIYFIL